MRLGFTLLLSALVALSLRAQINAASPFPADFVITAPEGIAGIYDYGTQTGDIEWGVRLSEDLAGEVAWAFNSADSLGCDVGGPVVTDLTGKIGFIRRGACSFVEKVQNAQDAGAIGVIIVNHFDNAAETDATIFGMTAADSLISDSVTIPAVFVSRGTGALMADVIDNGGTLEALFDVKSFYNATTAFSHKMPLDNYVPYNMTINYINPSETDPVDVTITVDITDPSGNVTTLQQSEIVGPLADSIIQLDSAYVPTEVGVYTVDYSHDQAEESLSATFQVTESLYATDDILAGEIVGSAGPSQELYLDSPNGYEAAALVFLGGQAGMAVQASFGLENPQDFFDIDDGGETFDIIVYQGPVPANATGFSDLTVIGGANYTVTGDEQPNETIFVEFEDPIALEADGIYYVSIRKTIGTGLALPPRYTASGPVDYLIYTADDGGSILATPIALDLFYTGGWADATVAVRLYTDLASDIQDLPSLAADQVSIAPNPVAEQLNVRLNLSSVVNDVKIGVFGIDGRQYGTYSFDNVGEAPLQINVNDLVAGTYFLSIQTPEGYRAVRFVKQ